MNSQQWSYDNVFTPKTKEDLLNYTDEIINEKVKWKTEKNGWETFSKTSDSLLEQKKSTKSNSYCESN